MNISYNSGMYYDDIILMLTRIKIKLNMDAASWIANKVTANVAK